MTQALEKKRSYKKLMALVWEAKEKTFMDGKRRFPDEQLNHEALTFLDKVGSLNYVGTNKRGNKQLMSGWYEHHTKKQIDQHVDYWQDQLSRLHENMKHDNDWIEHCNLVDQLAE